MSYSELIKDLRRLSNHLAIAPRSDKDQDEAGRLVEVVGSLLNDTDDDEDRIVLRALKDHLYDLNLKQVADRESPLREVASILRDIINQLEALNRRSPQYLIEGSSIKARLIRYMRDRKKASYDELMREVWGRYDDQYGNKTIPMMVVHANKLLAAANEGWKLRAREEHVYKE